MDRALYGEMAIWFLFCCGALLVFVGAYLSALEVGTCPRCPHCRAEKEKADPICPIHKLPRGSCEYAHKETPDE